MVDGDGPDDDGGGPEGSVGQPSSSRLQDVVNEGLTAAVRANDFHTGRQLLILYTLVASRGEKQKAARKKAQRRKRATSIDSAGPLDGLDDDDEEEDGDDGATPAPAGRADDIMAALHGSPGILMTGSASHSSLALAQASDVPFIAAPPPPPLDTDRLRSATNSDGLLAVLGAAEALKSMQDGGARRRASEAASAVEEWVEKSEHDMAFRVASWRDLRAAHHDLKIAADDKSAMSAFIGNRAVANRRAFAKHLREVISGVDFGNFSFLQAIHGILGTMNKPCLRLELLQYILGLDNRYSVAHVRRSVELAATCMRISAKDGIFGAEGGTDGSPMEAAAS